MFEKRGSQYWKKIIIFKEKEKEGSLQDKLLITFKHVEEKSRKLTRDPILES